jgi:Zn-dependent M16 (insulinase) family peptidase
MSSGWRKVASFEQAKIPCDVYRSPLGLTVCFATVDGPIVNGYFTLATEAVTNDYAHCDDGLPHTLEHLVFLGSDDYPFKGMLDQLANRCFAQGTNAWTDIDHTAYTVTTAGSEGFLNLLPIYLDHILFCRCEDPGFLTEVHHINGEGDNAGVVYCEMQARENTEDELIHQKMLAMLFPDSGYKSNTGGIMSNLHSLENKAVKQYHKDYYRPSNLCMIVTGQVDHEALFKRLEAFETKLVERDLGAVERPWSTPVNPLPTGARTEEISFPSEDESVGQVLLAWRGPAWKDFDAQIHIRMMWKYLTDSAVSPLMKALVEVEEDALCGDISYSLAEQSTCYHYVEFSNASTETLGQIRGKFLEVIRKVVDEEGVDMERIRNLIARSKVRILSSLEGDAHGVLAMDFISSFLYAEREAGGDGLEAGQIQSHMNSIARYDALPQNADDEQWWRDLIQRTLLDPRVVEGMVCVVGKPSEALGEELQQKDEKRVEVQAEALGGEGKAKKQEELDAAIEFNEAEIDPTVIDSVPIPPITSISFAPVISVCSAPSATAAPAAPPKPPTDMDQYMEQEINKKMVGMVTQGVSVDGTAACDSTEKTAVLMKLMEKGLGGEHPIPFQIQWDHIKSTSFVHIRCIMDTTPMAIVMRPYLELFLEAVYELPIKLDDGTVRTHEEVVSQLEADTVSFSNK